MFSKELTNSYPTVVQFLTNAITKNKLANSYVFIGKDITSIIDISTNIAKILNCTHNQNSLSTPCNNCINCKWLNKKEHPQALIIISPDATSKKEQIKIDAIRELLNTLNTTSDFYRVIFFQNASLNTFTPESCNLLLKTVEEPSEKTIFIFANSSKNDIISTILSRSQIIYLNKNLSSIAELVSNSIPHDLVSDCFSKDLKTSLEKSKHAFRFLDENKINIKDYLLSIAGKNYDPLKISDNNKFSILYKNLSKAFHKHKAFMQTKIVIEDLFLDCVE